MNRQIAAIVLDTLHEARARKVIVGMLFGSALAVAGLYWMLRGMALSGPSSIVALMSEMDPRYLNQGWVARGVFGNAAVAVYVLQLIVCLMHTMTLTPGLMEPRRNAWLVSHPISRTGILLGRFLGCLAIAFGSATVTFAGAWVVVGLKTGFWHFPFFFGLAMTLLLYASLSAAMLLLLSLSSSPLLMFTGMSAIAALNGAASRPAELKGIVGGGWSYELLTTAAAFLPRPTEVARLTDAYVQTGSITAHHHIWVSAAFAMACLTLAGWRFARKDF